MYLILYKIHSHVEAQFGNTVKTDFSHEKNLLHYVSKAKRGGALATNLVFCRYFKRQLDFFYQSSKEYI